MNTSEVIKKARSEKGLSKNKLSVALGISEMHVYDLESYENELEDTLSIKQIFVLSKLLKIPTENLCAELGQCKLAPQQAFTEIKNQIIQSGLPIEILSEQVGWELEFCAKSMESIKKQPIMFFRDFGLYFKIPLCKILPEITIT